MKKSYLSAGVLVCALLFGACQQSPVERLRGKSVAAKLSLNKNAVESLVLLNNALNPVVADETSIDTVMLARDGNTITFSGPEDDFAFTFDYKVCEAQNGAVFEQKNGEGGHHQVVQLRVYRKKKTREEVKKRQQTYRSRGEIMTTFDVVTRTIYASYDVEVQFLKAGVIKISDEEQENMILGKVQFVTPEIYESSSSTETLVQN